MDALFKYDLFRSIIYVFNICFIIFKGNKQMTNAEYYRPVLQLIVLSIIINMVTICAYMVCTDARKISDGVVTLQMSFGELKIHKIYRINYFAPGDDFKNVGGQNISGSIFTATGTMPTTWENGSILQTIGVVPTLKQQRE